MLTYSHHDGNPVPPLISAIVDLYALVYAEPPYEEGPEQVDRFRTSLGEEASRAGFVLITAHDGEQLVGAAYGWTMAAGAWWSRADQEAPPGIRDVDKFAVMEWIVHPQRRGEGIGAELIRQLGFISGRDGVKLHRRNFLGAGDGSARLRDATPPWRRDRREELTRPL
jgi:ribosomal protein S18 acetylase RimI-like enzyme